LINCRNITVENLDLSNTCVGIELWGTVDSIIADNTVNNIMDNTFNAESSEPTSVWNSPSELTYTYNGNTYTNFLGNYWDDYIGSDANNDGIGDTPYSINSDNDNYPLMEWFENYEIGDDITPPAAVTDLRTVDLTSSGFVYPTGKSGPYAYASWLAGGPGMPPYQKGYYHLGQDMEANEGDDVYAIADGEIIYVSVSGWGEGNYGLLIRHTLDSGEEFLALYGHVRPNREDLRYTVSGPVDPPVPVSAGEAFATIGPYDSIPHLHFGIHPGEEVPQNPWGKMPLDDQWPETNGFVDPLDWITTRIPFSPLDPTSSIMLTCTAPGDDGDVGSASEYDIRYSTSEITEANWDSANQCTGEPRDFHRHGVVA
jgi:murein DD-endopeptidase MepM/ murein hydrolase activator NlpD